jgi:hypothetical protein
MPKDALPVVAIGIYLDPFSFRQWCGDGMMMDHLVLLLLSLLLFSMAIMISKDFDDSLRRRKRIYVYKPACRYYIVVFFIAMGG